MTPKSWTNGTIKITLEQQYPEVFVVNVLENKIAIDSRICSTLYSAQISFDLLVKKYKKESTLRHSASI